MISDEAPADHPQGRQAVTAKTMAEVLAEHRQWSTTNPDGIWLVTCFDCGETLGLYDDLISACSERVEYGDRFDKVHFAHQAAALSAAGFGLVANSKP